MTAAPPAAWRQALESTSPRRRSDRSSCRRSAQNVLGAVLCQAGLHQGESAIAGLSELLDGPAMVQPFAPRATGDGVDETAANAGVLVECLPTHPQNTPGFCCRDVIPHGDSAQQLGKPWTMHRKRLCVKPPGSAWDVTSRVCWERGPGVSPGSSGARGWRRSARGAPSRHRPVIQAHPSFSCRSCLSVTPAMSACSMQLKGTAHGNCSFTM